MKKITVLFLCTHNSARSQLAEGLLRHFDGERYEAYSAGATPTHVNPFAITAMAEIGIDISSQYSKSIEEFRNREIDVVVSVCRSSATVTCPFCALHRGGERPAIIREMLPRTKHYIDHGFPDPSEVDGSDEVKLAAFREIRDEINTWIHAFFADLTL